MPVNIECTTNEEIKKNPFGNRNKRSLYHLQAHDRVAGEFPFTRGVRKDMYRGTPWTMRQYAGFSTAEESNKRYHYLLSQGTMGFR